MKSVLITYYTKTNTTKDICQYIESKLSKANITIDVIPLNKIADISPYDTIIIGAPINGMNWVLEATEFVSAYSDILRTKEVAMFFTSYLINNCRPIWQRALRKTFNKYENSIGLIATGMFNGQIDSPFTGIPRLIFGNDPKQALDRRDYSQVDDFIKRLNI